jgi:hypothetical protein
VGQGHLLARERGARAGRGLTPDQLDIVQDLAEGRGWAYILDTYPSDDLELTRRIVDLRKKRVVEYD